MKKSRNLISNVVVTKTVAPSNVCRRDRWAVKSELKYNNNSVPSSHITDQLPSYIYTIIQATYQVRNFKNGENMNIVVTD